MDFSLIRSDFKVRVARIRSQASRALQNSLGVWINIVALVKLPRLDSPDGEATLCSE